ncbi:hypothetical protein E5350_08540 [Lactobacillus johnsonii]|uniref:hypothetical protein n=1 Tax=Lactobacillus johnsonii TaxID=33959 RepID=UPI0010939BB1|nr:hypothetical protein [Lactobacillus johnsonii]TGY25867.1 hypothetical protein E5350_08540 [Lactobacillus johnsonii]
MELTAKDVYFNLLEPTVKRIAREQDNDTYLATIALDNGIRLNDSIKTINTKLSKLDYQPIKNKQDQKLRMKGFLLENWLRVNGYDVTKSKVSLFINKTLAKRNVDFYFLSKYLNVNNTQQLEEFFKTELSNIKQIDLTTIISKNA